MFTTTETLVLQAREKRRHRAMSVDDDRLVLQ
jgi:hypothetical protein